MPPVVDTGPPRPSLRPLSAISFSTFPFLVTPWPCRKLLYQEPTAATLAWSLSMSPLSSVLYCIQVSPNKHLKKIYFYMIITLFFPFFFSLQNLPYSQSHLLIFKVMASFSLIFVTFYISLKLISNCP